MFSTKLMTSTILLKRSCISMEKSVKPKALGHEPIKSSMKNNLYKKKVNGIAFQNIAYLNSSENNSITQIFKTGHKIAHTHIHIYIYLFKIFHN